MIQVIHIKGKAKPNDSVTMEDFLLLVERINELIGAFNKLEENARLKDYRSKSNKTKGRIRGKIEENNSDYC